MDTRGIRVLRLWDSIRKKLTQEEVEIMQWRIDASDPNRVCTEEELAKTRKQVEIGRKITEAEYFILRPPMRWNQ